jgi:hypothetical protein
MAKWYRDKATISVRGGDAPTRKLIREMAHYCAKKLMTVQLRTQVTINFVITKDLYLTEKVQGLSWIDCEEYRPKKFKIQVEHESKLRPLLETVAHEMVHIKQWASGDMYEYSDGNRTRYKKKQYNNQKIDYWDSPWEVEAHGKEVGLFVRFCEDEGYKDEKWAKVDFLKPEYAKRIAKHIKAKRKK